VIGLGVRDVAHPPNVVDLPAQDDLLADQGTRALGGQRDARQLDAGAL
jgi:hypothetical protein